VDKLAIPEYELLMKSAALREADLDYRIHMQAFLNVQAKAKKKVGKDKERLVFSRFDKFYDRQKAIDKIMHPDKKKSRFSGIGKLLRKGGS
jgi:hypothetical protein